VVDGSVEVDPCSPGVINSAGTTDALSGRRAINAYGVGTAQQTAARGDSTAAPGGDTAAAPNLIVCCSCCCCGDVHRWW
jgi:hypothetical protein